MQWLHAHKPAHSEVAVVHGDYRLDNMIVHPTEVWLCYSHVSLYEAPVLLNRHACVCMQSRVVAVLDWELCAIGDPLVDLAHNCMVYHLDSSFSLPAAGVACMP